MVSAAPGQDFQTVPHMFFVMQIRVIFALWCPLPWCPGQLPQSPTPRSATAHRASNPRHLDSKLDTQDAANAAKSPA